MAIKFGRGDEIRTHDDDFKDRCLRPLGDTPTEKKWSGRRGSNSRHLPWQGNALPTELLPHIKKLVKDSESFGQF